MQPSKAIIEDPLNVFKFENEWHSDAFNFCEDQKLNMENNTIISNQNNSTAASTNKMNNNNNGQNFRTQTKAPTRQTTPINDGRLPQELFEIIQIPPDSSPFKYENLWETELCDFFEDFSDFCCANCCYCCYIYSIFKAMDENFFSFLCTPISLMPIRAKLRAVLRIKGSLVEDCCQVCFCAPCVAFQIKQELKYKGIISDK